MSEAGTLVFETGLDAPPEKVWRALTIPEYRERWLCPPDGAEISVIAAVENRSCTFHWREPGDAAGTPEDSLVTVEIAPHENGGTWFRLTHAAVTLPAAANGNEPAMMLAA